MRISPQTVSILDQKGSVLDEYLHPGEEDPIVAASVIEPYSVARTKNGNILVFQADVATMKLKALKDTALPSSIAACLITDDSGVFRTFDPSTGAGTASAKTEPTQKSTGSSTNRMQLTHEQLERLQQEKPSISTTDADHDLEAVVGVNRGSHWLCSVLPCGKTEIRTLPELQLVFASNGLLDASMALLDDASEEDILKKVSNKEADAQGEGEDEAKEEDDDDDEEDVIQDIAFAHLGLAGSKPHLMVLQNNDQLVLYEATPRFTLENLGRDNSRRSLAVRFRKVQTKVVSRGRFSRRIIPWSTSKECGALVTGSSTYWVVADEATSARVIPQSDPVRAFCQISLPTLSTATFALADATGLHSLFKGGRHDTRPPVITKRINLERSYTHMLYDAKSEHYVGAGALTVPFQLYSDECEVVEDPEVPHATRPMIERSTLELFDPTTWTVIDGYEFEEDEVVLCMERMTLHATSDASGLKKFMVVGTSVNRGEDMSGRGKTYVFETAEVVNHGQSTSSWKLRLICEEEAKEPVTAIANLSNYLIVAEGLKVRFKRIA